MNRVLRRYYKRVIEPEVLKQLMSDLMRQFSDKIDEQIIQSLILAKPEGHSE